ncbi:MAG: NYN domain-containing protein [Pirellulales bacterium]
MAILIDGYNLLFASGIFGAERGERGGESSRRALLDFLVDVVPASELARTTIVFDAAEAPPGLPRELTHQRIRVLFAPRKTEADELLEQLIEQERDPKKLTVVSSDHRVQRAARRRRAIYVDSDVWYAEKVRERRQREVVASDEFKPERTLDDHEVASWLREFGLPPATNDSSTKRKP